MEIAEAIKTIDILAASLADVEDKQLRTYGDALCMAGDVLHAKLAAEKKERLRNPCERCGAGWGESSTKDRPGRSCRDTCEKLKAWVIAIDAETNPPLTLDDLQKMDGQPVWLDDSPNGWKCFIVNLEYPVEDGRIWSTPCCVDALGRATSLPLLVECGLYRHPPKEVHHDERQEY